jgi:hypothetical protein
MTLADITLPITDAYGKSIALVFGPQLAARLAELHAEHGTAFAVPHPRVLTDGRLMLCGDILTMVEEGGFLHEMWSHADTSVLLPNVEVIPWDDAVKLLPDYRPPSSGDVTPPSIPVDLGVTALRDEA